MSSFEVSRTLVKSPPEVWAELEKAERLAELLDDGAIRITRADPETSLDWEGSDGRGTIEIAASAWGTKVTLKAEVTEPEVVTEPVVVEPTVPEAVAEPEPKLEPVSEPEPVLEPEAVAPTQTEPLRINGDTAAAEKASFWGRIKSMFASPGPDSAPDLEPDATVADPQAATTVEPAPEPVREHTSERVDEPETEPAPEPVAIEPEPEPEPTEVPTDDATSQPEPLNYEQRLTAVLDHLGSAHKRPFVAG